MRSEREVDASWGGRPMRRGAGADVSWGGARGDVVCGMVIYIKFCRVLNLCFMS